MKSVCQVCGFVYDETVEKIPFSELPDDWTCPLCGAGKQEFAAEKKEPESIVPQIEFGEEHLKLSAGQLSALCANLSRACEKQYLAEEADLFKQLGEYFASKAPVPADADADELAAILRSDLAAYPAVRAVTDANADRGAARSLVWGEKVQRMVSSLADRFLREGAAFTKDTEVWVCTACGFIWIGDEAPEQCPVCKVPSWKFEKMQGRNAV